MSSFLSPRQFAAVIGVSESSVRRWADDGQIEMTRTAGGHRKIAKTEAIRFIRETSANVVRPDILQLDEPTHRRGRADAFAAQDDELFHALADGKAKVAAALLSRLYLNRVSVAEICDGPIRTAMRRIGELWPSDKRAIFTEHRATNICIDALQQLRATFRPAKPGAAIALGGALEKDPYTLPSMMVTTVLAELGFETINLGPNTPAEILASSAIEMGASIVWLALTAPLPKAATTKSIQTVTSELGDASIPIVVGGQAAHRYRLPTAANFHAFSSLSELSGFATAMLATANR